MNPTTDQVALANASNTDLFSVLYANNDAAANVGTPRYGVWWQRGEQQLQVLLPATLRAEIIKNPQIHRLPNGQKWLLGLVNIRGLLVPVIDFAAWVGLPSAASSKLIIHLGEGAQSVAWQIEQPAELLFIKTWQKAALAHQKLDKLVLQASTVAQKDWLDIDYLAWLKTLKQ